MFIKKLSIIDYQYKKHRQHVECKPEYDPQYDFTRNLDDKCEHKGAKWRCGQGGLERGRNWCWTKYIHARLNQ